jgi:uncharacterized membrane protein SirB2
LTGFDLLKHLHMLCAVLSIAGFTLRGYWMLREDPRLQQRLSKVLPHIVDTLLLLSAIGMLVIWHVSPFAVSWLTAKVVALLLYIGLGMVALRFGKTRRVKITAWILALLVAIYIFAGAYTKSPLGLLAAM